LIGALRREIEEMRRQHHSSTIGMHKDLISYRQDLESVLRELQNLMNAKNTLEMEIATYRKLLETEETRVSKIPVSATNTTATYYSANKSGGGGAVGGGGGAVGGGSGEIDWVSILLGPDITATTTTKTDVHAAKVSYNVEGSSDVYIHECKEDGRLLRLKNKSSTEHYDISGWTVNVDIDSGTQKLTYTIPDNTHVGAGQEDFKIWARGHKPHDAHDMEADVDSFGVGAFVKLTLRDQHGNIKYTLTRTTTHGKW